jgi:hypothetical protein
MLESNFVQLRNYGQVTGGGADEKPKPCGVLRKGCQIIASVEKRKRFSYKM